MDDQATAKPGVGTDDDREIICVVDPMCSWCWGFSPVIRTMHETYGDKAPVWLMAGGLRPMNAQPMTDKAKAETRHHWESVAQSSGQPFNFTFFDRKGFVYDTEPACRALVTVRSIKREAALPYLEALHRAFYAENRDITDPELLAELAGGAGVDREAFAQVFPAREMMYQTAGDFYRSQSMGIQGFPTVVLRRGEQLRLLVAGFVKFENLKPHLDKWIAGEEPFEGGDKVGA
jgi:putative protein-disulfide isomerase